MTINRPNRRNAVNSAAHYEFEQIRLDLARDRDVNAIRLTGAGVRFPWPAINADALGFAANISLLCDVTVVAEITRLADTHVAIGVVAGDGAAVIWPL